MEPVKGMVLCTKNSQAFTNAVVFNVEGEVVEVLSDFGNLMKFSPENLWSYYEVSESWLEHQMLLDYISITDYETLGDRIYSQIENLKVAIEKL